MNEMLQQAIAGEPVTVKLGGNEYPLAYPIQGVILYKRETAKLDRERAKDRAPLTREEKQMLRERRRKLLSEADEQRPPTGEKWTDENFTRFDELLADAVVLKAQLDEDAGAGDSLYDKTNWWKISPNEDPERMLLALWVGLHAFIESGNAHTGLNGPPGSASKKYLPQLSRESLGGFVDLGNGEELTLAIAKALRAHLIAPPEIAQDESLPNVQSPATPAEMTTELETVSK
jgi:hypothetical protein